MFYCLLERFESIAMEQTMEQLTSSVNIPDFKKMDQAADTLKGASGYVGAGRIYYACHHMNIAYLDKDYMLMVTFYPLIVEAVIEFRRYSRELVAAVRQQEYEEQASACQISLANNYRLQYQQS